MPPKARIDAPGALHYIMSRGKGHRKIFHDDTDRNSFIERFGRLISEAKTNCHVWALLPNHFHLLLKSGNVLIATVMPRLLTGYAVTFNRRHRTTGHLFHKRYKPKFSSGRFISFGTGVLHSAESFVNRSG